MVNERVLDACCAPGGKTGLILENFNSINLTSLDINLSRLQKVQKKFNKIKFKNKIDSRRLY